VGRDEQVGLDDGVGRVSIHAPRVGRDAPLALRRRGAGVSIHAPRVGRDKAGCKDAYCSVFQFTRPAWGATEISVTLEPNGQFQFTRPAWGATVMQQVPCGLEHVSIHAPRVGRDKTHPRNFDHLQAVSIHAPRVGRDFTCDYARILDALFQFTRPAWGATSGEEAKYLSTAEFQFTRPAWGATAYRALRHDGLRFQFTRPAWGATRPTPTSPPRGGRFQFTRPAWGATSSTAARVILQ